MDRPVRPKLRIQQRRVGNEMWFCHWGTWRGIPQRWNAPTLERLLVMLRHDKVLHDA